MEGYSVDVEIVSFFVFVGRFVEVEKTDLLLGLGLGLILAFFALNLDLDLCKCATATARLLSLLSFLLLFPTILHVFLIT